MLPLGSGDAVTLALPWPPSVNDYWRAAFNKHIGRVIVYTTREAKQYREDVQYVVACASVAAFPADYSIALDIVLHPPTRARRDLDNFNKCVWDGLVAAGVFADDCQVDEYHVRRGDVTPHGAVVVSITGKRRDHAEPEREG